MKTLTIILLAISLTVNGQDLKYAGINILSSSIIAGVGSGIHKHKNETFGHAFLNGFYKGTIGGAVQFTSKKMSSEIYHNQNYWFGLNSKIINSIGYSIVNSGCLNKPILSYYAFDFGFVHFETNFKKPSIMLNPCNLFIFGYEFFDKTNHFSFLKSIQTGTLYFDKIIDLSKPGIVSFGSSVCNVMMIQKETADGGRPGMYYDKYQTASHELIHTFQFESNLNIIVMGNPSKIKYINWDIPINMLMYKVADFKGYNNNFYEQEATWLSNKL